VVGGAVGIAAASTVCMNNSICTAQLVGLGSIAGIHGGIFAQKYFFLTQSQDNELAADSLGYKIAQRAGFRAEKIARFFEKIDQIKFKKNTKPQFSLNSLINNISTHPSKEDRLKLLQELQLQNNTESISQRSSSNFIDIQKQLLVR
ncbi:M48 family metalloprotease, partial [bacterium]|nr:M48 family metalloprotease [bacterium]